MQSNIRNFLSNTDYLLQILSHRKQFLFITLRITWSDNHKRNRADNVSSNLEKSKNGNNV